MNNSEYLQTMRSICFCYQSFRPYSDSSITSSGGFVGPMTEYETLATQLMHQTELRDP